MLTSKRILLGIALLLTYVPLHTADGSRSQTLSAEALFYFQLQETATCAWYVRNKLNTGPISMNKRSHLVGYFEDAQAEIQEMIKDEPIGSDKQEAGLHNIQLCEDVKHKLWEVIDSENSSVLP